MAIVDIVMPQLGESLTEGTIVKWHKKPGERIKKDETLLEISTDKVDSEIPSPIAGIVVGVLFEEQKTVAVKTVIARIETDEALAARAAAPEAPEAPPKERPQASARQPEAARTVKAVPASGRFYSPLVLSVAREEGVSVAELETITGTGDGGRVSKKDLLTYVQKRASRAPASVSVQTPRGESAVPAVSSTAPAAPHVESSLKRVETGDLARKYPPPAYEILQMSNLLQRMSEHMTKSVQTSPHVQAIHECDMTRVESARHRFGAAFEGREGFKLTYTPFVLDAVVKSLKQFPLVNSSVEGDKIIVKKFINLGLAVASESGLIVPVIKNAEEKNFVGLARAVADLAARTRARKLQPPDIEGGTFTITNYGVFGSVIGIPIINQPQVAILGIGAVRKRPVVVNDAIAIRPVSFLTLSFDHRIIDGALGGSFVEAVVKNLENFDDTVL